ncbi:MAG: sigma-70 family RNA polymerase sigma factor, partial [Candidatus Hydrogenedentales bacterium]
MVNLSLNRVKSERSRSAREERFAAEAERVPEPSWPEVERILDKAIAELPEHLRAPIVAHYLLGKSQSVIASEMGLSQQTVSYRIGKAIEGLRSALKRRGVTMASAALIAFLASQTADALPPALALTLGKTALASACGAAPPSAAALPLAVKGVLAVTTATKIGIGAGATAAIVALVWFGGVVTVGNTNPEVNEAAKAGTTQTQQKGDIQPATPANTKKARSAAQTASSAQEPPIG